jgi:hypothetical protein
VRSLPTPLLSFPPMLTLFFSRPVLSSSLETRQSQFPTLFTLWLHCALTHSFVRCSAMIKSWLAREWTTGKDGKRPADTDMPSWNFEGAWDEKALEIGELSSFFRRILCTPLPLTFLGLLLSIS